MSEIVVPMHEIVCPHCNKAFKIDEAGYADIVKQVRDREFEAAIHERLEHSEREMNRPGFRAVFFL